MVKRRGRTVRDSTRTLEPHQTQIPVDLAKNVLGSGKFSRSQIQNLLMRYHFLDTVSHMKPDAINGRIDTISADPRTRSMVDSLAIIYTTSPRSWLAIRKMFRWFHASELLVTLSVLLDALVYTNVILNAIPSALELTAGERKLVEAAFYDCVKARKLVMVFLRDRIGDSIHKFIFPNGRAAPSIYPQEANLVPHQGTDYIESKACSAARQSSKDHLAADIPRLCTYFSLETFGQLV